MLKKILNFLFLFCLLMLVFGSSPIKAVDYPDQAVHVFGSRTCPHCSEEKAWLKELKKEHPELKIYHYEVAYPQNSQLLSQLAYYLQVDGQGVPFTVIGNQVTVGYSELTQGKIYQMLDEQKRLNQNDVVAQVTKESNLVPIIEEFSLDKILLEENKEQASGKAKGLKIPETSKVKEDHLQLPFFGEVNLKEASLPLLTVMIAFVDGFNPCAMWVLMFLISLLLGMKNRKRMWLLGVAFILASAFVYFLFMTAWLNLFLFLGLLTWVRIAIGLLALFAAYSYLKDYVKNKDGACQVDLGGKKQKIFERLKIITHRDNLIWALVGIVALAFAVNLLELVCSAGLPAVYTQVLSLSDLTAWQHYFYLLLYILIFMLDDMVIFVIAMVSMKAVGMNSKYARYSHLIGGIMMLLIGLAMLFKPELIMFG